jgi:hypothetical protein
MNWNWIKNGFDWENEERYKYHNIMGNIWAQTDRLAYLLGREIPVKSLSLNFVNFFHFFI